MKKILIGKNENIKVQTKIFKTIVLRNKKIRKLLEILDKSSLENYYIAFDSVTKTFFNYYNNLNLIDNIDEYKIITTNITDEEEKYLRKEVGGKDINLSIEVVENLEDKINNSIYSANAIGIKMSNGILTVYAPYGFNDLFSLYIRKNLTKDFRLDIYNKKIEELSSTYQNLIIEK